LQEKAENIDIAVPKEVLTLIDQGSNPELRAINLRDKCIEANEGTAGRIHALKDLRGALSDEISATFPAEWKDFEKQHQEMKPN